MSVETTMETPFGEVEVFVNDADHIAVFANGPLNVPGHRRTVMVNRVEYVVTAHFTRDEDGSFATGHPSSGDGGSRYFSCRKADSHKHDDFSWSAHDKLKAGLTERLNVWVTEPEGREAINKARVAAHVKAVNAADARVTKLKAELAEAEAELLRLEQATRGIELMLLDR